MKLVDRINACQLCEELSKTRTQPVIGEGPVPCDIVFLGEAPGKTEDETGRPFVGAAGKTLEHLALGVRLLRGVDYHILNILKCRPPENRNPEPEEIENCRPYLDAQIKTIKPKIIVAFGRFAQAYVLGVPPSKLRVSEHLGDVVDFRGTKAILNYHPSYVNRAHSPEVRSAFVRVLRNARKIRDKIQ